MRSWLSAIPVSAKCEERINQMRAHGVTILFVSHSIEQVQRICHRALWLDHGHLKMIGPVDEVCRRISASMHRHKQQTAGLRPAVFTVKGATAMQENTPTLHTDRLILRRFALHDDKALFALLRDEEVNRFLPWFPFASLGQTQEHLQSFYLDSYRLPFGCRYAVCLKEDDHAIGMCI